MTSPRDDTESARPAELAERRARRAVEDGLIERAERAERTVGALERRLDEAEGRLEVAQRERSTLAASLGQTRRDLTAALQREFSEQRLRADEEGEASGALAELEAVITRLGADHDAAEARAAALDLALQEARAEFDAARARPRPDHQAAGPDERRGGPQQLPGELEQARPHDGDGAEREVTVEKLVGELVKTAHGLQAEFERQLEGLSAQHDAAVGRERARFLDELAGVEQRVDELTRATGELREELVEERSARCVAEAELGWQRGGVNRYYDRPLAGPSQISAEHPALARTAPPASAPAVVGDLARALDRLRGEAGEALADVPPAPARPTEAVIAETDWFSARLAAFAGTDGPAAERLLFASLAVQATTVARDVTYELELPGSGRHRVDVTRGHGVSVAPVDPGWPKEVEFRLVGTVSALAPLAGGSAPRRLSGISVRGRRRRLRRLLRSLGAPVGLASLRSADARLAPADLLAMLCDGVPAVQLAGADFSVAYDVADVPGGTPSRTVVRAWSDGRLGLDSNPSKAPDAVISLEGRDLLGLLDGSLSATVLGNRSAAETLLRWLRGVQGL